MSGATVRSLVFLFIENRTMRGGKTMDTIYRKKKRVWLLIVVITMGIVMVTGALLWILSLEGTVTGLWANVMSVVFTFLGVLYALLQWLA
jgi:hypothetical protein